MTTSSSSSSSMRCASIEAGRLPLRELEAAALELDEPDGAKPAAALEDDDDEVPASDWPLPPK